MQMCCLSVGLAASIRDRIQSQQPATNPSNLKYLHLFTVHQFGYRGLSGATIYGLGKNCKKSGNFFFQILWEPCPCMSIVYLLLSPAGAVGPGTGDIATPPVRLSVCLSVRLSVCPSVRHV